MFHHAPPISSMTTTSTSTTADPVNGVPHKHFLRPFRVPSPSPPTRPTRARSRSLSPSRRRPIPAHPSYPSSVSAPSPTSVSSSSSALYWLALYFFFNLSLTLYNKSVLVRFPFPYTLTALHAFFSALGSYTLRRRGYFRPAKTSARQKLLLLLFSVLYTVNIAVSNLSLQMVTIPFHQVVRSTTPLFTLLLSVSVLRSKFSIGKLVSLIPVVAGVALATYGDYQFTTPGLLLTFFGTLLASVKTIATNLLQSSPSPSPPSHSLGQPATSPKERRPPSLSLKDFQLTTKLHPLDLLLRMSPLAFIQCIIYAHISGEFDRITSPTSPFVLTRERALALATNGLIAFGLNVVSFTANKKTSALTMTVAANIKQVLTILLAVSIFNLTLSPPNAIGIVLTLVGGGWYGLVEYREKQTGSRVANTTSTSRMRSSFGFLEIFEESRRLIGGFVSSLSSGRISVGGMRVSLRKGSR